MKIKNTTITTAEHAEDMGSAAMERSSATTDKAESRKYMQLAKKWYDLARAIEALED
jgi:hypothetical protein